MLAREYQNIRGINRRGTRVARKKPVQRLPAAVRPPTIAPTIQRPAPKRVVRKAPVRPSLPPPKPRPLRTGGDFPAAAGSGGNFDVVKAKKAQAKKIVGTKPDWNDPVVKQLKQAGLIEKSKYGALKGQTMLMGEQGRAPVLKALEQTTRPVHAVAGASLAALEHRNVPKAALRGLENKDKTTFSKVLKKVGAPKGVQTVGGFALDVAADPLTYVTFGAGSVAKKVAVDAAARASEKALKAGLTKEQAVRFGERAARQAAKKPEGPRGVTVKLAGKEVPGVRKATAATTGKLARKVGQAKPAQVVRNVARDVNPNLAPSEVTKQQWQEATSAARTARATTGRKLHETQQRAVALRKAIGKDDQIVHDAIETGTIGKLSPELQVPANALRSSYRHIRRMEKQAGIRGGTIGGKVTKFVDPNASLRLRRAQAAQKIAAQDEQIARRQARKFTPLEQRLARGDVPLGDFATLQRQESEFVHALENHRDRAAVARELSNEPRARYHDRQAQRYDQKLTEVEGALERIEQSLRPGHAKDRVDAVLGRLREARQARQRAEAVIARGGQTRRAVKVVERAPGPKSYVPHYTLQSLGERAPSEIRSTGSVGKRVIRPASSRARIREGTLAEKRQQYPGQYNEDAALAYANRMAEGHRSVTQAELNRRLADSGKPVKPGRDLALGENEGVFRLKGSDLTEIRDPKELARIADKGHVGKGGRFVVLDRDVVTHAHAISRPGAARSTIGTGYDKVQGAFKLVATQPNPAFHIRNLIGDLQNAYLGQSAHRLPGNVRRSSRALRSLSREEKAQRTLSKVAKPIRGSVKIGGKPMSYDDLAREAAQVGAIRTGFTNRELYDLLRTEEQGVKEVSKGVPGFGAVKRTLQAREDLPRLATYIEARRRGMNPEQASQQAAKYHFDYANLTEFERRVARRALPFYTFTSRNIPLQAKTLVQRPGKYANYQKIREEAAAASGMPPDWEKGSTQYQQRTAPIPISWKGHKFQLAVGGLPLTDLSEFPGAAGGPITQSAEYLQRGVSMTSPIVKNPLELLYNYSTFFRDKIRRENAPLVAAPSFVAGLPQDWKDRLHVAQIVDKRTGQKSWGWDARADYVARSMLPGVGTTLMGLTAGPDRVGRGTGAKALGLTGVRPYPYEPQSVGINNAYDRLKEIQTSLAELGQQGVHDKSNAKRAKLNAEARQLERDIYRLSQQRGDKQLPKRGGPKKARKRGGFGGGGLGGGFGGSGFGGGF